MYIPSLFIYYTYTYNSFHGVRLLICRLSERFLFYHSDQAIVVILLTHNNNNNRRRHAVSVVIRSIPVRERRLSRRTESFIDSSAPSLNLCIIRERKLRSLLGLRCGEHCTRRVLRLSVLVRRERKESFDPLVISVP